MAGSEYPLPTLIMPKPPSTDRTLSPEYRERLQAELKAPYRPLRKFIYITFGASGVIGGVIFLAQLLSGQATADTLTNLCVQTGVVALMVFFWRLEQRSQNKPPTPSRKK